MKRIATTRSPSPGTLWRVAVLCGLLAGAAILDAQESNRFDSPLWWALTEELSPAELRAAWEDPVVCRARLAEAVRAGVWALPDQETVEVRCFGSGELTPELIPFWQAFHSFAMPLASDSGPRLRAGAVEALARHGLTGAAADRILEFARQLETEAEQRFLGYRDQRAAFVEILRQAQTRLPRELYRKVVRARDAEALARTVGRDPEEVARWMRAWERNPLAEQALLTLPRLKTELTTADWQRLRDFLLVEVAPRTTVVDFFDG